MAIRASRTLIGWIDVGFWLRALSSAFMMKRVEMPNMPSRLMSSAARAPTASWCGPFDHLLAIVQAKLGHQIALGGRLEPR